MHRALLLAAVAATAACFVVPAALMVVVAFGSQGLGVALGFIGLVAFTFGPWILFAAYLGALLIALVRRATGLPIMGLPLRSCQLAGLGLAAGMTLLGALVSNEVELLWLVLTLPAGVVGGSVFYRASRVASSLSAP